MYRRTGLALFLIFGLWAAWIFPKDVTYVRGKSVNYEYGTVSIVHVYCGEALPILRDQVFDESIPAGALYMKGNCEKAARSHLAWVGLLGAASLTFLLIGLIRGRAPTVTGMDAALKPLPTPDEMRDQDSAIF